MRALSKSLFLILLVGMILSLAVPAAAGGQREDPIDVASQLIDEKRFNDAIIILSEIMQTEPTKFDEAQSLVNNIRREREKYNEIYAALIDLYSQEELDMDRAYEYFRDLEDLDADPNRAAVEAYEKARETAVFVYNNKRFQRIMDEAAAQLAENDYSGAVETYLTGFDLHIDDFEDADYGSLVTERLVEARETIRTAAEDFILVESSSEGILTPLLASIGNARFEEMNIRFPLYEDYIMSAAQDRKQAFTGSRFINSQNRQIMETREKEPFHLTYLYLLTRGRSDAESKEGILGAIDLFYADLIGQVGDRLTAQYRTYSAEAHNAFDEARFAQAGEIYETAYLFAETQVRNVSLWETRLYAAEDYRLVDEDWSEVTGRIGDMAYAAAAADAAESYAEAASGLTVVSEIESSLEESRTAEVLNEDRTVLQSVIDLIEDMRGNWEEKFGTYSDFTGRYPGSVAAVEVSEAVLDDFTEFRRYAVQTERSTVTRIADLTVEPLYSRFREQRESAAEGRRLLEGYEKTIGEGETANTITAKDPEGAREVFTAVLDSVEDIRGEAAEYVAFMEDQQDYIREGPAVAQRTERGRELIREIDSLDRNLASLLEETEEQVLLAGRYENEAVFRLDQARQALNRNQFDNAREQLKAAGERFDLSLSIQEDPELRERRDSLITSLSEEINTTENNIIVTEVRDLIESAKDNYAQEQYQSAERLLMRAQSRWSVTHVDTKPEIDYWLQLVRVALYVRSGRQIAETDPLYAEMSQLLNLARENFLTGKRLVEAGRREAALPYFEEAEKNILYVKIAFPLNQEASVLSLRILRYKDLENFETLFRQRVNEARSMIATNPQQAYIDLKDLEAIDPDYPGLSEAIYTTEIRLGIRVPPPDQEKIRQANDLYNRAFSIVRGNVRSQFPIALEYLNRAIELTPDNQRVTSLLDRVEAEVGGRTTTVLSNAAQQQYRLAEEKYIDGSYYEALRIVDQLLKDEANSQYPPLLELKRRIESNI